MQMPNAMRRRNSGSDVDCNCDAYSKVKFTKGAQW